MPVGSGHFSVDAAEASYALQENDALYSRPLDKKEQSVALPAFAAGRLPMRSRHRSSDVACDAACFAQVAANATAHIVPVPGHYNDAGIIERTVSAQDRYWSSRAVFVHGIKGPHFDGTPPGTPPSTAQP